MFKVLYLFLLINLASSSDVVHLTESNFENKLSDSAQALVYFFKQRCGTCLHLNEEYEAVAGMLKQNNITSLIAKVDCTTEINICGKYEVREYPTLKFFKYGKYSYDYHGEKSATPIIKFVQIKHSPISRLINNKEDMIAIDNLWESVVFGYFKTEGSDFEVTFQRVADKVNEYFKFARTFNEELAATFGFDEGIYIIYPKKIVSKFEDAFIMYPGPRNAEEIETWIYNNILGIGAFRQSGITNNEDFFKRMPLIIAYYDIDFNTNKESKYWRTRLVKVVKKFTDSGKNLNLAVSNSMAYTKEMELFGIKNPNKTSIYIALLNEKRQRFKMDDEFTLENFEKFIENYLAGNLVAFVLSEDIPPASSNRVKTVVAKNFDEIVNDPSKDVLIKFYSPSCLHCEAFAPVYENLAGKLYRERNLVIVKMDATANEIPIQYKLAHYPSLYFVPKKEKTSPIRFDSLLNMDDVIKFIAAESTDGLRGFDRDGNALKSEL